MLVLTRKKNEAIVIGHDVTISIVEIRGDKVRLGIESPKEVPVHRKEGYDAIYVLPGLWENLLPKLMAQYERGRKSGLALKNPAELKDTFLPLLPVGQIQFFNPEVLYVDPTIPTEELARAYGFPSPPPGLNQTLVKRPERPYLLFWRLESGKIVEPLAALEQWHRARSWNHARGNNLLLPAEALLLAAEHPDFLARHGITIIGMASSPQPFTPGGKYPPVLNAELVKEAYFPSLVSNQAGSFRWILHQGALENCTVPAVASVV